MKQKIISIVNLIIAALIALFTVSYAFAWFIEDNERPQKFNGSSSSPYFESGTGALGDPFIISNHYHLYNLAWLQNTGRLTEEYYFQLKDDITIPEDFWLPPIGTDDHPFEGVFDGNYKIIKDLKITTDTTKLAKYGLPQTRDSFSNAVGMFGMTAPDIEETEPKIYNFSLVSPIVEVANANVYNTSDGGSENRVGFAIGYAKCGAVNIGVLEGTLAVKRDNYTTENGIIGGYNSALVNGDEINGDITEGGDTGQFIPDVFANNYSNLTNIMGSSSFNSSTWVLPYNGTVSEGFAGVGLGAFSLIAGNTTEIRSSSVTSFTYYTTKTSGTIPTYNATGGTLSVDLSETNSNTSEAEEIRKKVLNGETQLTSFSKMLFINNSPTLLKSGLTAVYETNVVKSDSHSSNVYTNCIKVRVKKSSTKIFVIASSNSTSETRYLGVYKVSNSIDDFDTRVDDSTYDESALGFKRENPIMQLELPANPGGNTIVACEFDLTGSNAGAGTYQINSTSGGINIYYVSVTGTTDGDVGSTVTDPRIENVDYIYRSSDDTSILTNIVQIGTVNWTEDSPTNVIAKFINTATSYYYYYRAFGGKDSANSYTLEIEYNGTAPTAKASGTGGKYNITENSALTVA